MKQRLTGIAALLALGALMAGVPWLFLVVASQLRVRFDLTSAEGWWQALTTRDDGSLLIWVALILGAIAWAALVIAVLVEIVSRLRHVTVPRLRGLAVPQAIAHGLVAAVVGAVLASNTATGSIDALAVPVPVPADTSGAPSQPQATPQAKPDTSTTSSDDKRDKRSTYVVKKGDTLWDIAADKLGDPYAYPMIFKASKETVQPDGRRLTDPDLIYPGWKLTIPSTSVRPKKVDRPKEAEQPPAPTPTPTVAEETPPPSTPTPTSQPGPTTTVEEREPAEPAPQLDDQGDDTADQTAPLPWMLAGLGGAGALLAGGLWLTLRRQRAAQSRFRRLGRTIPVPDEPALAVVEQTLMHQGDLTSELVERIAQTTQRLSAHLHAEGQPIPTLLGVDATFDKLTFRFADPVTLTEPWQPGADPSEWRLTADADLELIGPWDEENEPVWPTLVTLGQDQRGWRLLNLETLGVLTLTGDQTYAADLARYWIAELSVAHWSRDVEIAHGDLFPELTPLIRHGFWSHQGVDDTNGLLAAATSNDTHLAEAGLANMDAARADQAGPELWLPRVLITTIDSDHVDELAVRITDRPGRTGFTLVRLTNQPEAAGVEIRLTDTGRVQVPALGLDLVANGITVDEAAGCAALIATTNDIETDLPVPDANEPTADWQEHCDTAGHLHADLTVPRDTVLAALEATSLLPEPDAVYLTQAATTVEDLAELAPRVPAETTARVKDADPTLDQDLADWRADSTDRPRLAVLGPVHLRLGRVGQPTVGLKRVPYYTEIVAYLATRPRGATADELAEALGIGTDRVRRDLSTVRARLGANPRTKRPHVPDATNNAEADRRAIGVYLVEDLLYDADLFRRLRLRGEASGVAGIDDLASALQLVTGAPYEQLRRRGGLWLARTHDDHHLVAGIIDVAHILTTHALAAGDLKRARAATEIAQAVAPDDPTPHLDLARIADHEGRPADAGWIARELTDWTDRSGYGPIDPSERTNAILRAHRWLEPKDRVS
jgi:LysM repeat protein